MPNKIKSIEFYYPCQRKEKEMNDFNNKNTDLFNGKANFYNSRPAYAVECIDYLKNTMKISKNSTIGDIGAGTGILSRQILELGCNLVAIEPNKCMFEALKKNLSDQKKAVVIQATAENTTLDNNILDGIVVGTAFHWFDIDKFKSECKRILKKGSKVAILRIFNNSKADKMLDEKYHFSKKDVDLANKFFGPNNTETNKFEYELEYNLENEINLLLSSATAPLPSDENYDLYVKRIKNNYFKDYQNKPYMRQFAVRTYIGTI